MFKIKMSFIKNKEYRHMIVLLKQKFNFRYSHIQILSHSGAIEEIIDFKNNPIKF